MVKGKPFEKLPGSIGAFAQVKGARIAQRVRLTRSAGLRTLIPYGRILRRGDECALTYVKPRQKLLSEKQPELNIHDIEHDFQYKVFASGGQAIVKSNRKQLSPNQRVFFEIQRIVSPKLDVVLASVPYKVGNPASFKKAFQNAVRQAFRYYEEGKKVQIKKN